MYSHEKIRCIITLIILLIANQGFATDSTWVSPGNYNPLVPGYFADPTIRKFGDTYYLYATTDGIKLASGEPQVWISKDFVNWYNYEMEVPLPSGLTNCWAPDVIQGPDGKYYYFHGNCEAGCNIYGYFSDTPMGPWSRINNGKAVIPVGLVKSDFPALDAQYIFYDDTTLYAYFGTWCTSFGGMGWARIDPHDMVTIKESGLIPIAQLPNAFEAAYPMKVNNKYIFMYSSGDCRLSSYAIRYAYADKPTGVFKAGANNPLLETSTDGSIDGPGHHSVIKENNTYYILYHRHNNPHSTGGEFRQICADSLIFENDSTIKKIKPTHKGVGYLALSQIPYPNLAFGAVVNASSFYRLVSPETRFEKATDFKYLPEYAVDDNNATIWKASSCQLPQTLTIDLGEEKVIRRTMIQFEYPTFYYQYKIEYSSDSLNWKIFADKTNNRRSGCPMIDDNDISGRYLRITVTGTEKPGMFAAIWNVKVYEGLFEIPGGQNKEVMEGPGPMPGNHLLVDLNVDTCAFGMIVDNYPNAGMLGGVFLKYRSPIVDWVDSVKAVYFDGKSYLKLSEKAPESLGWNSPYTSAVWVYNPTITCCECLMTWCSRSNMLQASYTALMYGNGNYGAIANGDGYVDLPYKKIPEKAKWHHIASTFDGMIQKVYVDGEINTQLPINLFVTNGSILIGASGQSGENFSGFIARAQLYDSVFTDKGIVELMNQTRPLKVDAPISGILKKDDSNLITVFFDPADSKVHLNCNRNVGRLKTSKIIDMYGRIVAQDDRIREDQTADFLITKKGIYLFFVDTDLGVLTKKFVVY